MSYGPLHALLRELGIGLRLDVPLTVHLDLRLGSGLLQVFVPLWPGPPSASDLLLQPQLQVSVLRVWVQGNMRLSSCVITTLLQGVTLDTPSPGGAQWLCPLCNQGFSLHDRLAKHMASRHKVTPFY